MAERTTEGQRRVAGLWCGEVLDLLPDFVDGALDPTRLAAVHAHLAGCDWCERFGGRYGALVTQLRATAAPAAPDDLAERLEAALARAISNG